MLIADIMSDYKIIEEAVSLSKRARLISDVSAVGGALAEVKLCEVFNRKSGSHRLLTYKMVENLCDQYVFDFSKFAKSMEDYYKQTKLDYGYLSAADLLLFKKNQHHLYLEDAASLKTSSDPKNPTAVYIHNDSSNFIHESIRDNKNHDHLIGNIFMIMIRGCDYRVYHFDKQLFYLQNNLGFICSNKHGDRQYGFGKTKIIKSINRKATTHKKQTSFNRGLLFCSRSTKKENEFSCVDSLVDKGIFKRLTAGIIHGNKVISDLMFEMNL
jgi:hypothetical protein